ncbi:hypothetical protein FGB62_138g026 [Gracilaria domingensis]|nr:hypothetical protein FGB62_138g026 [Gracilaria domingensis]
MNARSRPMAAAASKRERAPQTRHDKHTSARPSPYPRSPARAHEEGLTCQRIASRDDSTRPRCPPVQRSAERLRACDCERSKRAALAHCFPHACRRGHRCTRRCAAAPCIARPRAARARRYQTHALRSAASWTHDGGREEVAAAARAPRTLENAVAAASRGVATRRRARASVAEPGAAGGPGVLCDADGVWQSAHAVQPQPQRRGGCAHRAAQAAAPSGLRRRVAVCARGGAPETAAVQPARRLRYGGRHQLRRPGSSCASRVSHLSRRSSAPCRAQHVSVRRESPVSVDQIRSPRRA